MSERNMPPGDEMPAMSREELMSAMFANMVVQQAQMAMVLLGKVAHPDTGEIVKDIDTARMFIDQLEMLEAKTKGNLSKQEEGLLRQALGSLRMAFVEAVEGPAEKAPLEHGAEPSAPTHEATQDPGKASGAPAQDAAATPQVDDSRKKFSKKY